MRSDSQGQQCCSNSRLPWSKARAWWCLFLHCSPSTEDVRSKQHVLHELLVALPACVKKKKQLGFGSCHCNGSRDSPSLSALLSSNCWYLLLLSCETWNSYRKNPNSDLEVLLLYWYSEENNLSGNISTNLRTDTCPSDTSPTDCPSTEFDPYAPCPQ